MILFFPKIYKDELIYSMLSRYSFLRASPFNKDTVIDVYGAIINNKIELPSRIDDFARTLSIFFDYDSDYYIENHTLFSLYTAFLSKEKTEKVKNYMKTNQGQRILTSSGLIASNVPLAQKLRYCQKCAMENIKENGEYFLNRKHQISAVYFCSVHKCLLSEIEIDIKDKNRNKQEYKYSLKPFIKFLNENFEAEEEDINKKWSSLSDDEFLKFKKHNLTFIESIEALMNINERLTIKTINYKIREILKIKGYMTITGILKRKKLVKEFDKFYSKKYLDFVYSQANTNDWNWIISLSQSNKRRSHVIRYLLLLNFLEVPVKQFFYKKFEYKPFKKIEKICRNDLCDYYGKSTVKQTDFYYNNSAKKTSTIYECKHCHHKYRFTCIKYQQEYIYTTVAKGSKKKEVIK